jgi:hypothetical protein
MGIAVIYGLQHAWEVLQLVLWQARTIICSNKGPYTVNEAHIMPTAATAGLSKN